MIYSRRVHKHTITAATRDFIIDVILCNGKGVILLSRVWYTRIPRFIAIAPFHRDRSLSPRSFAQNIFDADLPDAYDRLAYAHFAEYKRLYAFQRISISAIASSSRWWKIHATIV